MSMKCDSSSTTLCHGFCKQRQVLLWKRYSEDGKIEQSEKEPCADFLKYVFIIAETFF